MFNKMFHLPSIKKTLSLANEYSFLAYEGGGSNVMKDFMLPSTNILTKNKNHIITFHGCSSVQLVERQIHVYPDKLYMHCIVCFARMPYFIGKRSYQMNFVFPFK